MICAQLSKRQDLLLVPCTWKKNQGKTQILAYISRNGWFWVPLKCCSVRSPAPHVQYSSPCFTSSSALAVCRQLTPTPFQHFFLIHLLMFSLSGEGWSEWFYSAQHTRKCSWFHWPHDSESCLRGLGEDSSEASLQCHTRALTGCWIPSQVFRMPYSLKLSVYPSGIE